MQTFLAIYLYGGSLVVIGILVEHWYNLWKTHRQHQKDLRVAAKVEAMRKEVYAKITWKKAPNKYMNR